MRLAFPLLVILCAAAAGCRKSDPPPAGFKEITLPGGQQVYAEVVSQKDMARGMMLRASLPPNRAMLFLHLKPGYYPYWMFNVRIPLDIIWMKRDGTIVEISPDTPPCLKDALQCPSYGGHKESQFVLELAGGSAAKWNLRPGQRLKI
ncbi:MAG: DUF192 domain-containing protein [Candidatus Solibacter usitatus]|nr:DUF192 domain-containing protein [Candidatus Solibacter usitatus]